MYSLVVFDMDGTLLNTLNDLAAAGNSALEQEGFPVHPVAAYKAFAGSGIQNLFKRATTLECHDKVVLQRLLQHFFTYYDAHGDALTRPYSGIIELLKELCGRGIKTAILSNKPHRYVPALAEQFFPGLINLAYGQREGIPIKPAPQPLLEICSHFSCDKATCVYIGDSDVDMLTGVNAGVATIGVTWGFRAEQELREAGADRIASDPSSLLNMLTS